MVMYVSIASRVGVAINVSEELSQTEGKREKERENVISVEIGRSNRLYALPPVRISVRFQ